MTIILILVIALVAFLLWMQWRVYSAGKALTGRPAPEGARHGPRGVIYYFHHPRCGPCRQMGRVIDEVAAAHPEQVVKINIAEDMTTAQAFGIMATPTTILVKDGLITKVILGVRSVRKIEALLE